MLPFQESSKFFRTFPITFLFHTQISTMLLLSLPFSSPFTVSFFVFGNVSVSNRFIKRKLKYTSHTYIDAYTETHRSFNVYRESKLLQAPLCSSQPPPTNNVNCLGISYFLVSLYPRFVSIPCFSSMYTKHNEFSPTFSHPHHLPYPNFNPPQLQFPTSLTLYRIQNKCRYLCKYT